MVQSWNVKELKEIASKLDSFQSAQIQGIIGLENAIVLEIYHQGGKWLWWFELHPVKSFFAVIPFRKQKWKKKDKPLSLFMKAHLVNYRFESMHVNEEFGRVCIFQWKSTDGEQASLEFRLFPHGQNLILNGKSKQISWNKPRVLEKAEPYETDKEVRDLFATSMEWLNSKQQSFKEKNVFDGEKEKKKQIQKKQKTIQKLKEDIERRKKIDWNKIGNLLKTKANLDIGEEYSSFLDQNLSWQENMQKAFQNDKEKQNKINGQLERLVLEEQQLRDLEDKDHQQYLIKEKDAKHQGIKNKIQFKARIQNLSEDLRVFVGKNASENMELIRRARPWYQWLHLKDLPGAHAVIEKNKNRELSDKELQLAGNYLIKNSKLVRSLEEGDWVSIQCSECRYVRPIKGDKVGRVSVQKEKIIRIQYFKK